MLSFNTQKSLRGVAMVTTLAVISFATACGNDGVTPVSAAPGFLGGTSDNHEIGVVVNSTLKAVTMFQLGSPATQVQIPLGASATVTPVGLSLRGRMAAVPLGNAASVSLVDLATQTVTRTFTFPSGNTTGSVWANDTTFFAANTATNKIGRVYINQTASEITSTVDVGPSPTAMVAAKGRVFAILGNLDTNYMAIGNGIVTAINPATNTVIGSVQTGGTNPTTAAVGPDSLIYVLNTGDYVTPSTLTIIDPATLTVVTTVSNVGTGMGAINIDAAGMAYLSSFSGATTVWNTKTRTFLRGSDNPVCAKLPTGVCRGAADATANSAGKLYQAFFGSASRNQPAYIFVYSPASFALTDSISVGSGPIQINIRTF
jgi:hypothetical protein